MTTEITIEQKGKDDIQAIVLSQSEIHALIGFFEAAHHFKQIEIPEQYQDEQRQYLLTRRLRYLIKHLHGDFETYYATHAVDIAPIAPNETEFKKICDDTIFYADILYKQSLDRAKPTTNVRRTKIKS